MERPKRFSDLDRFGQSFRTPKNASRPYKIIHCFVPFKVYKKMKSLGFFIFLNIIFQQLFYCRRFFADKITGFLDVSIVFLLK